VVLKLPDCPPVFISGQVPPPELLDELEDDELVEPVVELDALLLDDDELELLLDELLEDDELVELVEPVVELDELEELLDDELELLLDEELEEDELLLEELVITTEKVCTLCAPQLLVCTTVLLQDWRVSTLLILESSLPGQPKSQNQEPPPASGRRSASSRESAPAVLIVEA
jgi:hypothetical protein